ncbi:16S rRNA (uracil(1498)-N(3))-methyltransferase [Microbacterium awajiense]|uniref:Ribosomal RNA small subunit methyltransferase E n=1 Tax=Microbacterium awajiense TaxID=415214 RepID=A0ABP7A664_9MICO
MALHFLLDRASDADVGDEVVLSGTEAHHASAVRRVRAGERVSLGDGHGARLDAEVVDAQPRAVTVRVLSRTDEPAASPRIVLAQALAKGDRDELAIQAATELGVDEIVPWQASRSVSRWDAAKAVKGRQRWSTIVREASKQALRVRVPAIAEPMTTSTLARRAAGSRMLVLEPTASAALTAEAWREGDERDVVLVVGPEGGVSPEERALFADAGATAVRLGDTVLRTSTAGPAAIALIAAALGRW